VTAPPASHLVCWGCGAAPDRTEALPFRCPNAGHGDIDHVLVRVLETDRVRFPAGSARGRQPFAHYRHLLHSYHRAIAGGMADSEFVDLTQSLDDHVAGVDGRGFAATPFNRSDSLSDHLGFSAAGGVWVKDETGNVAGSHKGRHLMGVLLHLEVAERLGLLDPRARAPLAIASCGNAALAAAVIARAGNRHLRVFVPVDTDSETLDRLRDLGADVVICARGADGQGDPTYARLRKELAAGAIPFTCQGSENGLAIEGGETIGYEMVSDLATGTALDHVVVQVGGGALASACIQAFTEAVGLGALRACPRIHTAQTTGAHPLERAYHRVAALLDSSCGPTDIVSALHTAATHRSSYMWPWEAEPKSVATGILDDETYDWRAVVSGMLASRGGPMVVTEERLDQAHRLGQTAGFPVDPTGTAGLAGLLDLVAEGIVGKDQHVAVLFTGVQR
jgi:threonine synthase